MIKVLQRPPFVLYAPILIKESIPLIDHHKGVIVPLVAILGENLICIQKRGYHKLANNPRVTFKIQIL